MISGSSDFSESSLLWARQCASCLGWPCPPGAEKHLQLLSPYGLSWVPSHLGLLVSGASSLSASLSHHLLSFMGRLQERHLVGSCDLWQVKGSQYKGREGGPQGDEQGWHPETGGSSEVLSAGVFGLFQRPHVSATWGLLLPLPLTNQRPTPAPAKPVLKGQRALTFAGQRVSVPAAQLAQKQLSEYPDGCSNCWPKQAGAVFGPQAIACWPLLYPRPPAPWLLSSFPLSSPCHSASPVPVCLSPSSALVAFPSCCTTVPSHK